jgi:hypothetical protein
LLIISGQDERSLDAGTDVSDGSEGSEGLEGYVEYTAGLPAGIFPDGVGEPNVVNENADAPANVQIPGDF